MRPELSEISKKAGKIAVAGVTAGGIMLGTVGGIRTAEADTPTPTPVVHAAGEGMKFHMVVPGVSRDMPLPTTTPEHILEGSASINKSEEDSLIVRTNNLRIENGLKPLATNQKLTAAAEENAKIIYGHVDEYMLGQKLDLHNLDGTTLKSRLDAVNYHGKGASENVVFGWFGIIGFGPHTEEDKVNKMMELWLGSTPHKANMLKPGDKDVGIGCVDGIRPSPTNSDIPIMYFICVQDFGGGE